MCFATLTFYDCHKSALGFLRRLNEAYALCMPNAGGVAFVLPRCRRQPGLHPPHVSFSIVYRDSAGERTLDLVCKARERELLSLVLPRCAQASDSFPVVTRLACTIPG